MVRKGPSRVRSVIAVDGIDGSGKSMLARQLTFAAGQAGLGTVVLETDDFRRPVDWRQADRTEADIYYDEYYDLGHLDRCLRAFLEGASSVAIPVFDSRTERLEGTRTVPFTGASVAIVEGVFALRVGTVAAGAPLVYLRTSFDEARRRILARDTARGRTSENVRHRIDARYFPSQERYLRDHDPLGRAHVIVDNEDFSAPRIARVEAARLHPVLAAAFSSACGAFASLRGVE